MLNCRLNPAILATAATKRMQSPGPCMRQELSTSHWPTAADRQCRPDPPPAEKYVAKKYTIRISRNVCIKDRHVIILYNNYYIFVVSIDRYNYRRI